MSGNHLHVRVPAQAHKREWRGEGLFLQARPWTRLTGEAEGGKNVATPAHMHFCSPCHSPP